jgi:hypothetical protein
MEEEIAAVKREINSIKSFPGHRERRHRATVCSTLSTTLLHQLRANMVFSDLQAKKEENTRLLAENETLKRTLETERDTHKGNLHMNYVNGLVEGRRQILVENNMTEQINRAFIQGEVKGRRDVTEEFKLRDAARAIDHANAAVIETQNAKILARGSYADAL